MPWLDPKIPGSEDGGAFPEEYLERSPPITWNDPGTNVQSYAILLEDTGITPPRVHWCVFDLPEPLRGIAGGLPAEPEAGGGKQATNDLGTVGYASPSVAPNAAAQFRVRVYALTSKLGLKPGAAARDVVAAISGKVSQLASRVVAKGAIRRAPAREPVRTVREAVAVH